MIRQGVMLKNFVNQISIFNRFATTLTPQRVTEILARNEANLAPNTLPKCIESIECNQLASNNPIEDRLRITSLKLPGCDEPTLILGVFDGHGGGTTVELIKGRLFNYIALALCSNSNHRFGKISKPSELRKALVDLHQSPQPGLQQQQLAIQTDREIESLHRFVTELPDNSDISTCIKNSFSRCDDDLSIEIRANLRNSNLDPACLPYYASAAVSGCCAIVMVVHQGAMYVASSGDCRAVLGLHDREKCPAENRIEDKSEMDKSIHEFNVLELNDEHNCYNVNEIRRLAASHPKSELNTIIKHNRLLGRLAPFRAFGDYNFKWSREEIESCGIARAYGLGVIPSNYTTPPYLTAEPDVKEISLTGRPTNKDDEKKTHSTEVLEIPNADGKYLVMASDGLWELFESSRDVIQTVIDHSLYAKNDNNQKDFDSNCATHVLRSALRSDFQQDASLDPEQLTKLYHIRLESTLTLPHSVVRNFRDDISIIVMRLR